jgi:hypothetical protein
MMGFSLLPLAALWTTAAAGQQEGEEEVERESGQQQTSSRKLNETQVINQSSKNKKVRYGTQFA